MVVERHGGTLTFETEPGPRHDLPRPAPGRRAEAWRWRHEADPVRRRRAAGAREPARRAAPVAARVARRASRSAARRRSRARRASASTSSSPTCGCPGMDGAALLRRVQRLQPDAVRIILSGSAEPDVLAARGGRRAPVPRQAVRRRRARAHRRPRHGARRARRATAAMRGSQATALPSRPALYAELSALLGGETGGHERVAQLVERDVAITAKVLQLDELGVLRPAARDHAHRGGDHVPRPRDAEGHRAVGRGARRVPAATRRSSTSRSSSSSAAPPPTASVAREL